MQWAALIDFRLKSSFREHSAKLCRTFFIKCDLYSRALPSFYRCYSLTLLSFLVTFLTLSPPHSFQHSPQVPCRGTASMVLSKSVKISKCIAIYLPPVSCLLLAAWKHQIIGSIFAYEVTRDLLHSILMSLQTILSYLFDE